MTGVIRDFALDFTTGKPRLTLTINEKDEATKAFNEFKDCEKLTIDINKHRKKRTNDANAYFWVLVGKLASVTKQFKTDIYRQLIREIGDNFEILPVRNDAVDTFVKNWGGGKLGWICDILGDSKLEGYTNVCAYYGSSCYNTKQMSDLIDSIIFECKEQGIETLPPDEIENLKSLWRSAPNEKHNTE